MTISMDKQYRTRDGREVRIYAIDGKRPYPIHGAYFFDGEWILCRWYADGGCWGDPDLYLVEVKPRIQREYWVSVYRKRVSGLFETKEQCDWVASDDRLACVKITIDCEEGEGL